MIHPNYKSHCHLGFIFYNSKLMNFVSYHLLFILCVILRVNASYQECRDGSQCYNGSSCYTSNVKDPITNEYVYHCDCSKATTEDTFYAGKKCEFPSSIICSDIQNEKNGSKFCTNGGLCMITSFKGKIHGGCACPNDFIGAHCQYVRADVTGGLGNEVLFSDVQENFWTVIPNKSTNEKATSIAVGISLSVIGIIAIVFGIVFAKREKIMAIREKRISMDPNVIEADGSSTMKNNGQIL